MGHTIKFKGQAAGPAGHPGVCRECRGQDVIDTQLDITYTFLTPNRNYSANFFRSPIDFVMIGKVGMYEHHCFGINGL
jgi:hypothetical protein